MSVAQELLHNYQHVIEELTVQTGSSGIFDVEIDGNVVFSKKAVGRHAQDGEVLAAFREVIGTDVPVYER